MLLTCGIRHAARSLIGAVLVASCAAAQDSPLDAAVDDFSALQTTPTVDPLASEPSPMPTVLDENVALPAREAFAQGEKLLAQGDAAGALVQFNAAVQADPTFALGHIARARGLAALGQPSSAIRALAKALTLTDSAASRPLIYFERGRAYYDSGEYQKAIDDFDRAAELQPGNADVAYQRGQSLTRLAAEEIAAGVRSAGATLQQAVAAFDRALAIRSDFADALAGRASARADLGETDEAIEDLTSATAITPDDASMEFRLAVLYLRRAADAPLASGSSDDDRRADLNVALSLLQHVIDLPVDEEADQPLDRNRVRLTQAAAQVEVASLSGNDERTALYESAIENCASVVADDPRQSAAHFQQAVALRLLGRYREAIAAFTEALRLAPENTEAHIRRGIAWFYLDEYDLAVSDFKAVGLVPGDPRPMFWIGVIHARRRDHMEAIRAYSEAIDENPRFRLAYTNRAISLMHLGHFQRAIDDWNRLIQLDPSDGLAYHRRGMAQRQLGREDEAQRSYAQAQARLGH